MPKVLLLKNMACLEVAGAAGTIISASPELAKQLIEADAASLLESQDAGAAPAAPEAGPELKDQVVAPPEFTRATKPLLSGKKK